MSSHLDTSYEDVGTQVLHLVPEKLHEVAYKHHDSEIVLWTVESAPWGLTLNVWLSNLEDGDFRVNHILEKD